MLRPFYSIQIQQVPTELWADRTRLINLDFVNLYEIEQGWEKHTNTCKLILPKNIILKNKEFLFKQRGTYNVTLGGSGLKTAMITEPQIAPLLMKGDVVYIQDGYIFKNEQGIDVQVAKTHFNGYLSYAHSNIPIEVNFEDNFFLLKRVSFDKTTFKGNLIDLCKQIVSLVNEQYGGNSKYNSLPNGNPYPMLSVNDSVDSMTANFSLGYLDIGNKSCAELLAHIKSQYKIDSYFRGNVLYFGTPIYDETTANSSNVFRFQNNIYPEHNLTYKNKDDVKLSAIVTCKTISKTGKKTNTGKEKTKNSKQSVLIYWDIASDSFKYLEKKVGDSFPKNTGGERHEFVYPVDPTDGTPSIQTLVDFGINQLKKYFYTGFKGSFKTLGYPFVEWGDNIYLVDSVFFDRNGQYKVKKVVRRGGMQGISQEIYLDYRLNNPVPESFKKLILR